MRLRPLGISLFGIAAVAAAALIAAELPSEPHHDFGQSITPAYEGWFQNPDGSYSFLIGYYNRNLKQELDIPVGPNNRIEPGGPDRGQPTHFMSGRQWGLFTVTVPKDFGKNKLTWTLVANGVTTSIPFSLDPLWVISPLVDATKNTPPFISFGKDGPMVQGPSPISVERSATLANPLGITVWVADDAIMPPGTPARAAKATPVSVAWSKFRGPGAVTFTTDRPAVEKTDWNPPPPAVFAGSATTSIAFSEPGEYVLRLVANDVSGDGGRGFQCCWTNAFVKVTVQAGSSGGK
ncbi:MAG TPA: hypothetical protein VKX49_00565 [Bryobacteraceae bacterium]|nr:hypothetical protein [Bryobacteraceae bacterium]